MYNVSEEYLRKINSDGRITRITGTMVLKDGTVEEITNETIAKLPEIDGQCSGDSDLKLGQAYQKQLKISIYSETNRYSVYGAKITLSFELMVSEGVFEPVPLGVFVVSECVRKSNNILQIIALDEINKLDRAYDGEKASGTAFQILRSISKLTGVELGQTEEELNALPNGTAIFGIPDSASFNTFRDVVGDLAAVLGGFALMDRQGKLVIRSFASSVAKTITKDYRKKEAISDYIINYTKVSCVKDGRYISVGDNSGQEISLSGNAFLQLGVDTVTDEILKKILNVFKGVEFTPASFEYNGDPSLDLGDLVEITGYGAKASTLVPIHKFNWKWRGMHKIEAVGKNPFLNATSKASRQIETVINNLKTIENTVLMMNNENDISFGEDWVQLGDISFGMASDKHLTFNAVVKVNMMLSGTIAFKYSINGVEDLFIHEYQVPLGIHTITLFIPIKAAKNEENTFKVFVRSPNSSGVISFYDFRGAVSGSGIITVDWDGNINVNDSFNISHIGKKTFPFNDSDIDMVVDSPINGGVITEVYDFEHIGGAEFNFTDELSITTVAPIAKRITEDGRLRFTEADDGRLTE